MKEQPESEKTNIDDCCCQPSDKPNTLNIIPSAAGKIEHNAPWMAGSIETSVGEIPLVKTDLLFSDKIGSWKARWNIGRTRHRVEPGLYGVGHPTSKSPVFVSANYKMSFDRLRSQLSGTDGWILVLDTKGINVWCAAGKGTFGTEEIINRIFLTRLAEVVSHRRLIVPQLGAPGVAAHKVKEKSGFRVIYGPVRSRDIPAFMESGLKATPEMRRVRFNFWDRIVLIPNDFMLSLKYAVLISVILALLSGFGRNFYSFEKLLSFGVLNAAMFFGLFAAATILPQAMLPWLPARSFSAKGAWVGLILSAFAWWFLMEYASDFAGLVVRIAWSLIIISVSSFIAMNYTGSSTYTSLSGVKKEMKRAVPLQISFAVIGLGLWIAGLFI